MQTRPSRWISRWEAVPDTVRRMRTGGVKADTTHDYVQAPAHLIEKARKIEAVCKRHGVELGAAAMQFPLFHPALFFLTDLFGGGTNS